MRAGVVVLLGLTGCQLVFSVEPKEGPAQDGPPSPELPQVSISVPDLVLAGTASEIEVSVSGTPRTDAFFKVSTTGGSLPASSGTLALDPANGFARVSLRWQPPEQVEVVQLRAEASYEADFNPETFTLRDVAVAQRFGSATLGGPTVVPAMKLLAAPIQIDQSGRVIRVSVELRSNNGGQGILGVYTDDVSVPKLLLGQSALFDVPSALEVIDLELTNNAAVVEAGTRVWVVLLATTGVEVGHTAALGGAVAVAQPTFAMPPVFPGGSESAAGVWALTATVAP